MKICDEKGEGKETGFRIEFEWIQNDLLGFRFFGGGGGVVIKRLSCHNHPFFLLKDMKLKIDL